MKIITSFVNPPIPVRNFDWQAVLANYDGDDKIGNGATEEEAIEDLLEKINVCPKCGADNYTGLHVRADVGDPTETYCECNTCWTEFKVIE